MLPHELTPRQLTLPETDRPTIALITGNQWRHRRFAYRFQQEFGDRVVAWYQIGAVQKSASKPAKRTGLAERLIQRARANKLRNVRPADVKRYFFPPRKRQQRRFERELFEQEVEDLKRFAVVEPTIVSNVRSAEFRRMVRAVDPYFFLSLGGPLYPGKLLKGIRGVCINQHAGWSPTYKGAHTTWHALYRRDLDCVGSTVHITTSGADAGPILRRSHPCLIGHESPETCFAKVVALGTELMIECVHDIIADKNVLAFEQQPTVGRTYLGRQLNSDITGAIFNDFEAGWLAKTLKIKRVF